MTKFYEDSGISSSAVSQWSTGKTVPRPATVAMIADYLGTTYEYLLTGAKEEPKEKTAQADGLSMKQKELIFLFSHLPEEKQEEVLAEVKSLLFG